MFSNIGAFLLLWNRQNVFMLPEKYSWEPRERPSQNIEFKLRLKLLIKSSENPKVCLGVGFQFSYIYDKNNDNDNITLERNFTSLRIIRWTPHLSENNWYSYYFISIFWTFLSLNQVHSTHNDQWISWFPSVGKKHWRVLDKPKHFTTWKSPDEHSLHSEKILNQRYLASGAGGSDQMQLRASLVSVSDIFPSQN